MEGTMTTVSDFMLKRLAAWGVRRIYGYPGDGINGIIGAFGRGQSGIEFFQVRHEELSAFMACAHAKFSGEVGVCLATSGPGAIHLLNGLYDAKLDHQPVLAIVGQQNRMALGGDYQQEVDLLSLFKDVAGDFVHMATHPAQMRHLVDRAMRIARERRTVTCIIIPNDVQEAKAVETPPHEHGTIHTGIGFTGHAVTPPESELQRAAAVLNAGRKVAILAGAGALQAGDELLAVAERLGAGIAKALLGKACVADGLPYVTGSIGLLGTKPSWDLMQECDALLMVGTAFPYSEFLPKEGRARAVQIDIDGRMLNLRYPVEVGLVGDSAATLGALLPLLEAKADDSWRRHIEEQVARWWRVLEARAMNDADPINPQRVFWELSPRLPDQCIITCDSGTSAGWYARDLQLRRGMQASLSGGLATMGSAVPYAVAAKYACPGRHVIALAGDGAMQMNGINALITVAKVWREWDHAGLTVMVLNNRDLNMVSWEQRVTAGDPRYVPSQALPDFPFARYAELLGLRGIRVDRPDEVGAAWDAALASDVPTVVEMVTDPNVAPLPPHVSAKQALAYARALLKGDPDAMGIVTSTIKETWDSLFPPSR
jgi:pyruvate dehydrogenase (quinone)